MLLLPEEKYLFGFGERRGKVMQAPGVESLGFSEVSSLINPAADRGRGGGGEVYRRRCLILSYGVGVGTEKCSKSESEKRETQS